MKIIKPQVEFVDEVDGERILKTIEKAGRVCYKSEDKISDSSCEKFVMNILKSGHEAVLEHGSVSVRFICDRGVTHELVRHRIAAYCQESSRYCNYGKEKFGREITVIEPCFFTEGSEEYGIWKNACLAAERAYFALLDRGRTPQEARDVLPTSLKTEIVVTADIREWRNILKLRTAPAAHPQMREVMLLLLAMMKERIPFLFDDINDL